MLQQQIGDRSPQNVGVMAYRDIQRYLTERNADDEALRPCVVDIPRNPTAECRSILHIGNPYIDNPPLISIPSRVAPEEVQRILDRVVPIKEFCLMLEHLASSWQSRRIAIIEGETSIGKTLAVNTFTRLLYGEHVAPLDFYCVGQTDVGELIGKWVPDAASGDPLERLKHLVDDTTVAALLQRFKGDASGLASLAGFIVAMAQADSRPWKFQLGAIPKAMSGKVNLAGQLILPETPGEGFILHVQEVGLARPAVVDAFLKVRGERAQLASSIQIWEHDGLTVPAGESFFVVMTTNPPENYIERNEIDLALVRASEFLRLGHLSDSSLKMIAKSVFTGKLHGAMKRRPPVWGTDLREANELGLELASFLALFHQKAVAATIGGESGRAQRILPTTDDFDRVRGRILFEQVLVDGPTGILEVDILATLKRAIEKTYLQRLTDTVRTQLENTCVELLTNDVGRIEFRGNTISRAEVLQTLCEEFLEKERRQAPSKSELLLAEEQKHAEIAGLQAQARARWERLSRAGYLPA